VANQPHIVFQSSIGKQKPQTYTKKEITCPFCDREQLENIISEDGNILFLMNKYPVLKDTLQTLIIETDECDSDLSKYPKEHLYRFFKFALKHWFELMKRPEYKSVILFRNFGPLSGGTIAHPHSQIIGFENYDYVENILPSDFEGLLIEKKNGVEFTISTKPKVGFTEFNVMMEGLGDIHQFADYTQLASHYILNHFPYKCSSYNIFFYYFEGNVIAKIVPRFVTTPLFIGYNIQQVSNNLEEIVSSIHRYFEGRDIHGI